MARKLKDLAKELTELPSKDRASRALTLIDSLDDAADEDVEKAWMEEAERRYDAYKKGEVPSYPADEVFAAVRDEIRR